MSTEEWARSTIPEELLALPDGVSSQVKQIVLESWHHAIRVQHDALSTYQQVPGLALGHPQESSSSSEAAAQISPIRDLILARLIPDMGATGSTLDDVSVADPEHNFERPTLHSERSHHIDISRDSDPAKPAYFQRVLRPLKRSFFTRSQVPDKPNISSKDEPRVTEHFRECLACTEEFSISTLLQMNCEDRHNYCNACFDQLVQHGCANEQSYPPRCCKTAVDPGLVYRYASKSTQKLYSGLACTLAIPPKDRWYCPRKKCSKLFDRRKVPLYRLSLRCPHCRQKICAVCREIDHPEGIPCDDPDLKPTKSLGSLMGWKICYKCRNMVEVYVGCRHVICRCGAEFCYTCLKQWPNCVDSHDCFRTHDALLKKTKTADGPVAPLPPPENSSSDRSLLTNRGESLSTLNPAYLAELRRQVSVLVGRGYQNEEIHRATLQSLRTEISATESRIDQDRLRRVLVKQRFLHFREEITMVTSRQYDLVMARLREQHESHGSSAASVLSYDLRWLQEVDNQRRHILAEDRALLLESGTPISEYRTEINSLVALETISHIPTRRQAATKVYHGSVLSRPRASTLVAAAKV